MINSCGDMVKGRSAADLTPQEAEKLKQASHEAVIVLEWAAQCTPGEVVQAEAYINGTGPLPQGAQNMIEEYYKQQEQMKQREQQEQMKQREQQEQMKQQEQEKQQKVAQKINQKPKIEKVGLDDLLGEEKSKKTAVSRSTKTL